jgi:hypothetical protein
MKRETAFLGMMVALSSVLAGCHDDKKPAEDIPAPTYSLGGTVSGLSGTGLVISNNGVNLAVASGGGFTFAQPVTAGAAYNVTVATQPTTPAQVCTVTNGSGVANANVSNVSVTCVTVTYTISGTVTGLTGTGLELSNSGGDLPIAADGNFTFAAPVNAGASYAVTVGAQPSLPAQDCTVANGTGTANANVSNVAVTCVVIPMSITGSTPANAAVNVPRSVAPTLTFSAMLDDATVPGHVTFRRGTQTIPATIAASADTVTVTPQGTLSLLTTYTIAADTGLLGLYDEPTAAGSNVTFTTVDGVWHPAEVARGNAVNTSDVQVGVTPDGGAVAVWHEYNGSYANVWANVYTAGTGWGTAQELQVANTSDELNPKIAVNAQGDAMVVWSQHNGVRTDIWYSRYTAGIGWGNATQLSASNLGLGNYSPQLAMNANGDAVFAWVNDAAGDYSVWARYMPANGAMGAAARIESAIGAPATSSLQWILQVTRRRCGPTMTVSTTLSIFGLTPTAAGPGAQAASSKTPLNTFPSTRLRRAVQARSSPGGHSRSPIRVRACMSAVTTQVPAGARPPLSAPPRTAALTTHRWPPMRRAMR